jgi:hypothetical protein
LILPTVFGEATQNVPPSKSMSRGKQSIVYSAGWVLVSEPESEIKQDARAQTSTIGTLILTGNISAKTAN